MRTLLLLVALPLAAQEGPPVEILRGELLKWDASGSFNIRTRDYQVRQCKFDSETHFTSRGQQIALTEVRAGNVIEMVSDRRKDKANDGCFAVTVYLLAKMTEPFQAYRQALGRQQSVLDHIFPRGRLTFSGIVLESGDGSFVLKTRSNGRKVLRLREDTHFAKDGRAADSNILEVNALVFVRAGESFDGHLEAYHVIRGQMVNPPD